MLFAPAATRADRAVIARECIGITDVARVPQDLDAGQQLNVTGRPAGRHHADAFALIDCGVFGPVLPQRILGCGFIGKTGFLIPPKDNGPPPSRLAARVDIERGRTAGSHILSSGRTVGSSAHVFPSRGYALRLLLHARAIDRIFVPRDIGGQILDGWLPMSDRCLWRGGKEEIPSSAPRRWCQRSSAWPTSSADNQSPVAFRLPL